MHNATNDGKQTFSFRGRSMQDAVNQLKEHLGADAVIVSTRRGSDRQGPFVEISARYGESARPPVQPQPRPAVGGAKRITNAYAQTAQNTKPSAVSAVLANLKIGDSGNKPFAERAAWLASQIQQREKSAAAQSPQPSPAVHGLPPELMALRNGALPPSSQQPQHSNAAPVPSYHGPGLEQSAVGEPQYVGPASNKPLYATIDDGPVHPAVDVPPGNAQQVHAAPQGQWVGSGPHVSQSTAPINNGLPLTTETSRQNQETEQELARLRAELNDIKNAVAELSRPNETTQPTTISGEQLSAAISSLDDRVGEIRSLLEQPAFEYKSNPNDSLTQQLIGVGVSEKHANDLASRMVRAVPGAGIEDGDFRDTLHRMISDDLVCGGALETESTRRRILAFVGPTGVGKTTTIAKVASEACLKGMRVALVTVDTFRMAAVEQLARFAHVLNAPLRIARDAESLERTLEELSDFDLVLVDTTGRSPRAQDQVDALGEIFPSGWGGELVLTLACSTRERDIYAAIESYSRLGIERLCLTKTDETDALGVIYSASKYANRPVAWTTFGQNVPDDIESASSENWARKIVSSLANPKTVALAG